MYFIFLEDHNNYLIFLTMGRHDEWRKIAKRERRRRIRRQEAILRDNVISPSNSDYHSWLKEQEEMETFEREQIEAMNSVENEKWIAAEKVSMQLWKVLQQKKEKMQKKRLEQEEKLRLERELEQKLKEEEEKRLKEIEEENKRKQHAFMEKLELFLSGDSEEPPPELLVSSETKPNHDLCPFFVKTGCCRFGNQCSRNHQFPGISKVILAANFFTHFGINNAIDNEYDADAMLEYEYSETYKDFKEFFYDVLPEFEKFGQVIQFKSKSLKGGIGRRLLGLGDGLNHQKSRFQEGNGLVLGPGKEVSANQEDETNSGAKTRGVADAARDHERVAHSQILGANSYNGIGNVRSVWWGIENDHSACRGINV